MRHAAGQASDGFHLLRLMELMFQPGFLRLGQLAFGDVKNGSQHSDGPAFGIELQPAAAVHPPLLSIVLTDHFVFPVKTDVVSYYLV